MRALLGAEKQGVVVLVASTAGIRANYLASLYSASKHAIVGFVKSMGQADVEEGVRVNCILPGLVNSPLWHDRSDSMMQMAKYDERKPLQPSDIADVMVKMVESKEYEGGTCVLKTPYEEKIQEEGYLKQVEKLKEYDPVRTLMLTSLATIRAILKTSTMASLRQLYPRCAHKLTANQQSPRPEADNVRIRDALGKERGKKWA